jgi:hypothetical protein
MVIAIAGGDPSRVDDASEGGETSNILKLVHERLGDAQFIGYWRRWPPPVDHCRAVWNQLGWDPEW